MTRRKKCKTQGAQRRATKQAQKRKARAVAKTRAKPALWTTFHIKIPIPMGGERAHDDKRFIELGYEGVAEAWGSAPFTPALYCAWQEIPFVNADLIELEPMDADALIAKLATVGLDIERGTFEALAVAHTSAWACTAAYFDEFWAELPVASRDLAGVIGVLVWRHWMPTRPFAEAAGLHLYLWEHELLTEGAGVLHESRARCEAPLIAAWDAVKALLPPSPIAAADLSPYMITRMEAAGALMGLVIHLAEGSPDWEAAFAIRVVEEVNERVVFGWDEGGASVLDCLCALYVQDARIEDALGLIERVHAAHPESGMPFAHLSTISLERDDASEIKATIERLEAAALPAGEADDWHLDLRLSNLRYRLKQLKGLSAAEPLSTHASAHA